jgi:hypothetical protein
VVKVEVALRRARKASEGVDGAGGQGARAAAPSSATGVSHPGGAEQLRLGELGFQRVVLVVGGEGRATRSP